MGVRFGVQVRPFVSVIVALGLLLGVCCGTPGSDSGLGAQLVGKWELDREQAAATWLAVVSELNSQDGSPDPLISERLQRLVGGAGVSLSVDPAEREALLRSVREGTDYIEFREGGIFLSYASNKDANPYLRTNWRIEPDGWVAILMNGTWDRELRVRGKLLVVPLSESGKHELNYVRVLD